jgi:hypothetical protein
MSSENIQKLLQTTPKTAYINILISINITFLFTRLSLGANNGGRKLILYSITVSYLPPYIVLQFYCKKNIVNCGIPHET